MSYVEVLYFLINQLLFVEQQVDEERAATFEAEKVVQEALNGGKTLARSLDNGGNSAIQWDYSLKLINISFLKALIWEFTAQ